MKTFPCDGCGAPLQWSAEAESLECPYCGAEAAIPQEGSVEELDFETFLERAESAEPTVEQALAECKSCGAETTFEGNTVADRCPYCDTPLVLEKGSNKTIKPRSLLPFKISRDEALTLFRKWILSRWFAPNRLKHMAMRGQLNGVYIPYWTYDSETETDYRGERGEYYYVTETYTTMENGESVTKTRQVRHTRWYPASGRVRRSFDDVLVLAADSLPRSYCEALEPWDLASLVPYQDQYLSGFRAETYKIGIKQGFSLAQDIMAGPIRSDILRDIGGDDQRIHSSDTEYWDIRFKHVLLPIWISSYRFNEKVYRFLINARSGEVQGERPYSWVKITLLVLAIAAVIGTIVYFAYQN